MREGLTPADEEFWEELERPRPPPTRKAPCKDHDIETVCRFFETCAKGYQWVHGVPFSWTSDPRRRAREIRQTLDKLGKSMLGRFDYDWEDSDDPIGAWPVIVLPEEWRDFLDSAVAALLAKRKPAGRPSLEGRDQALEYAAHILIEEYGYALGRNDATRGKESACSIISQALKKKYDLTLSEDRIEDIIRRHKRSKRRRAALSLKRSKRNRAALLAKDTLRKRVPPSER